MQKNVIFIDLYPQKGHFYFNNEIISAFTKFANVTVRSPEVEYLTDENKKKVTHILENKTKLIYEKKNRLKYLELFYNYYLIAKQLRKNDYSMIYILTFHNTHLILFLLSLNKKTLNKMFFNIHNNLSSILISKSPREKIFFSLYQNKINAVCNSLFIYDTATYYNFKFKSFHLLSHPSIYLNLSNNKHYKYDCVFISLSNNKKLLKDLIIKESESRFLIRNNMKIFMRHSYNSNLDSIDIDESDWINMNYKNSLLASTWSVGVFFDSEIYKLRVSASIIEALSNNKLVFATKTDVSEYYSNKYPSIVILVDSIDDYFDNLVLLKNNLNSNEIAKQFITFREHNSCETLTNDCKLLFNQIKNTKD